MKAHPTLLEKLAYPRVREALAERAATRYGVERAHQLAPLEDRSEAAVRIARSGAIAETGDLPLGGIEEIRPLLADARDGRMLEGREILNVAHTLDGADRLRRALAERERAPLLALARGMGSFDGWLRTVRERLDADGEVRDDATPKLREIRRRLRPLRGRIRERMEALMERHASAIQDPIVTLRRDRYVLSVRASAQSQVPGIALDASDSGKTVFLEPQGIVAMNNELALLQFEERDEVRRILLELGRTVADREDVDATLTQIGWLDLANASARLAEDWGLQVAQAAESVRLPAARHPLIQGCVANDLTLSDEERLLIVTGPNAGGKTVLLKTLGLAVAMAQSGLGVAAGRPGEPPRLPWYRAVLADIGDEQSIEASLSTYAGHLTNLRRILTQAQRDVLVLIDELGSGTDPDEGASLSQAILEQVLRSGATGLVTTHLAPLKVFASDTPGVRNAAMRFDVDSLSPTFELAVGQPGRSYALAIAERLGLGEAVLSRARELLGPEGERLERLLATLEQQRATLALRTAEAEAAHERAVTEAELLRSEIARLREREDQLMADAAAKAERELQEALKRATRLSRTARAEEGERRSQAIDDIRRMREEAKRGSQRSEQVAERGAQGGAKQPPLRPGVPVHVASYGAAGQLVELREHTALVQLGLLRVEVDLSDLKPLAEDEVVSGGGGLAASSFVPGAGSGPGGKGKGRKRAAAPVATYAAGEDRELNLRGERVEEGLEKLRDFLLEADAMRMPSVRILHGKGTGALRDAVRSFLRDDRRIERFEDAVPYEGGHGVTVAYLRSGTDGG